MSRRWNCVMALAASLPWSCAAPNFYPAYPISIDPPAQDSDVAKVEAAATSVGFVFKSGEQWERDLQASGRVTFLKRWTLPSREYPRIGILKMHATNSYKVWFNDKDGPGRLLTGQSCIKYMEFVVALKRSFGSEQSRLKFQGETCDPNGTGYD